MGSFLHGAGRQARDDAPLEQQHHEHRGDGDDDRGRRDLAPHDLILRAVARDGDRDGPHRVAHVDGGGDEIFVPDGDEADDRGREDARRGQRIDDRPQDAEAGRAVEPRGFFHRDGDF